MKTKQLLQKLESLTLLSQAMFIDSKGKKLVSPEYIEGYCEGIRRALEVAREEAGGKPA